MQKRKASDAASTSVVAKKARTDAKSTAQEHTHKHAAADHDGDKLDSTRAKSKSAAGAKAAKAKSASSKGQKDDKKTGKSLSVSADQALWYRMRRSGLVQPFASVAECAKALGGVQSQAISASHIALFNRVAVPVADGESKEAKKDKKDKKYVVACFVLFACSLSMCCAQVEGQRQQRKHATGEAYKRADRRRAVREQERGAQLGPPPHDSPLRERPLAHCACCVAAD